MGDMLRNEVVELFHRDGPALAAGLALPRLDGARVVAISPSLSGPERHGAAAAGTEADAREKRWSADHAGGRDLGIARAQMRLHGVEHRLVNDRRNLDGHDFADRLQRLVLATLVELVHANIGAPGENAVNLPNSPTPAVAREDAMAVQIRGNVLDAHWPARAVALQREPVDEPHRVGVQRIDFQFLLHLRAALFGRDDAVTNRRQGAVPEALPRVFLQGAENVLGVLLGLVFVEQRHDLSHHDVHRIIAHLLCDGDKLDAVLRELADVELKLEVVAEEAREAVNDDDIE